MLFSIFTVFIVWTGQVVAQSKEPSSLELLTNDFLTLSRITNAISIQSSFSRKTIKPHAVISELLKIAPLEFSEIISVDTVSAISALNNLENGVNGFSEADLIPRNELEKFKEYLEWIGSVLTDRTWHSGTSSDNVRKAIDTLIGKELKVENCDSDRILELKNLIEEYEKPKKDFDKTTRTPDADLTEIETQISRFLPCYKSIMSLNEKLNDEEFWNTYDSYNMAVTTVSQILNFMKSQRTTVPKLENDLEQSQGVWKQSLNENVTQLETSIKAKVENSERFAPPLPVVTVGFLEPEDMMKVVGDLKSDFFQKYFVKGAENYLKDFENSLKQFSKVAESFQNLNKVWKSFNEAQRPWEDMETVSIVLKSLATSTVGLEYFEESTKILEKCDTKPASDFEQTRKDFEKQNEQIFMDQISLLRENMEKLDGVDPESKFNTFEICLKGFLAEIQKQNGNKVDPWKNLHINIQNFFPCVKKVGYQMSLSDFFGKYLEMDKTLTSLLDTIENLKTASSTNIVTIKEYVEKSSTKNVFDCLVKEKFPTTKLLKVANFVTNLHDLPTADQIKSTNVYFQEIDTIKKSLDTVVNLMMTESRLKRSNPIRSLNNSEIHSEIIGICSVALLDLVVVRQNRDLLSGIKDFHAQVKDDLEKENVEEFGNPEAAIEKLLQQSDVMEESAKKLREKQDLLEMSGIFDEASKLIGIRGDRIGIRDVIDDYDINNEFRSIRPQLVFLRDHNLDFATYESRLKTGKATVTILKGYFDEIFEHVKKENQTIIERQAPISWLFIIWVSFATIFLLVTGALIIYGCTRKGREKYINLYLLYFGKPEDYEKRWRYSAFADEQDGKNSLLDAVREVNKVNLLISIKKGAYINAYNNFGNTALHSAVKGVYPEMVDILIRYGADRCLLNVQNRTPEQMIPFKYREEEQEKVEKYDKIKAIFKKYRKKKFRKMIPLKFPMTSFHIYIEDRTDEELTNRFREAFESITSIEVSQSTTHIIVKTSLDGIMETDRLDLLFWIFQGAILVKETWMMQCLENRKLIEKDFDFLVERVNYRGTCYETVLEWSRAMAKSEIPFLYGVYLAVVMKEYSNMHPLSALVLCQGGVFLDEFPVKENYRIGSHPYFHAHLGPLFLIHDGTTNLDAYKNDKDKMFTLFTEEQFIRFMLKREINVDTRPNPITVSKDEP